MKSVIELEINSPQARVAELYADPNLSTEWMDDIDRIEPISGEPGAVGSKYRLVPKKGNLVFVATVIERTLPSKLRLNLEGSNVTVLVKGTLNPLSPERTRLLSEEEFKFKGLFSRLFGFLARSSIKKAHRRHMDSFKRFVEAQK